MVLVKVERSISTQRSEEISILWEMSDAPDSGLVGKFGQPGISLFWVVGLHVEDVELGFERRRYQLVHVNVLPVEFNSTHSVFQVGVPSQTVSPQVEQLDVSVVIACSQHALFLVISISEGSSPAIRFDFFVGRRLERHYWGHLPGIPDTDAAITAASD